MTCSVCGNPFGPGDRFCGSCGAPAPEAAAPPPPPMMQPAAAAPPPWYRTGPGVLGIGLTIAAFATVAVVLIVGGDGGGGGTAAGTSSTTAVTAGSTTTVTTTAGSTTVAVETTTTTLPPTTTEATTTTTAAPQGFSEAFASAFMQSCLGGGNRPFCVCARDTFEATYTEAEMTGYLDGDTPLPDDWSRVSMECFYELPIEGTLPDFALPNQCTRDDWGVTVRYPTGWVENSSMTETPCMFFEPADQPDTLPIGVFVFEFQNLDDIVAEKGDPDFVYDFGNRVIYGYQVEDVDGFMALDYYTPLWPDVLDGPVLNLLSTSTIVPDAAVIGDMMLKGLIVEQYSP